MGKQPGRAGDHHGVHPAQGRAVTGRGGRRSPRLSRRPTDFGAKVRSLTGGEGVAAVCDGVGKSTFDASLCSLAIRGTLALYGASSGPVPPVDPQRLNAAGSVYLTRPMRTHFNRDYNELSWRSGELFEAIRAGSITVTTGERYRLSDVAQAHRDLENRKTHGSTVLIP